MRMRCYRPPCLWRALLWGQMVLFHSSCGFHTPKAFRVIPDNPAYLLRSPDARNTPFPDILKDYYGFEPARSWIELRPLMQLRIENAYYRKGSSRKGLDGFLGTEIARYELTAQGLRLLSVQHMLNRPASDLPVEDLIAPAVQKASQYRLYFEIVFNAISNTHGSVLLAGASQNDIERLAVQLKDPEAVCDSQSPHCAVFPDACSVSVEMRVTVNRKPESLVWGTLLSSITGNHPAQVSVKRLFEGRFAFVELDRGDPASLRFPLLPGDEISWK